jgi:hypothetical protein
MGYGKGLERLSIARTQLIARVPFFGHLSLKLRPRLAKEGDRIKTACVSPDGTLVISEEFLDTLSNAELCVLLAHEVMHPALLFWDRLQGRIPKLWNIAHDHAINLIIKEMGDTAIKPLNGTMADESYKNWAAEEVYDDLLKNTVLINLVTTKGGSQAPAPPQPKPGQGKPKPGQGKGKKGPPQPGPSNPYGLPQDPKTQKGKGAGGQPNSDPFDDPLFGDCRDDMNDSHEGQKAQDGDQAAKQRLEQDWKIAIVSAQQKH